MNYKLNTSGMMYGVEISAWEVIEKSEYIQFQDSIMEHTDKEPTIQLKKDWYKVIVIKLSEVKQVSKKEAIVTEVEKEVVIDTEAVEVAKPVKNKKAK